MKIREIPARKKTPWQLDCGVLEVAGQKRRVQLHFERRKDAEEEMARRANVQRLHGSSALALSESDRVRFAAAAARLAVAGMTIEEAVDCALQHRAVMRERISFGDMVARATGSGRWKEGLYLGSLKSTWKSLARAVGGAQASEVTPGQIEVWLTSHEWVAKTQRTNLANVSALFRWAMKKGLAAANPCERVEVEQGRPEDEDEEITCMSPEQAEALLRAAREVAPALLWMPVLGLFAGIRAAELKGLEAADIVPDEAVVRVRAAIAKGGRAGRSRRIVDLADNAVKWLKLWRRLRIEALNQWNTRCAWWSARRLAGWWLVPMERMKAPTTAVAKLMARERRTEEPEWPRNVMRHTFASMHYAQHRDERQLKAQMGHHASEDTLHRHYRSVTMLDGRMITPAAAAEFWAIRP